MRHLLFQRTAIVCCLCALIIGCTSNERVIKPQSLVAKQIEGDYEVTKFLVNGLAVNQAPSSVLPGTELKIDLTFVRKVNLKSSGTVLATLVLDQNETENLATGSHLVLSQARLECSAGQGSRTVKTTLTSPSTELSDFAEMHSKGRYFYLIVAEDGSQIAAHRFNIDKH